jgi:CubicO group peptidase (beta-lactamase class C family)
LKARALLLLGILALVTLPAPGIATQLPATQAQATQGPPPRGPRDPAEIDAFLGGLMDAFMTDHHVAGAVVSVVRDGALLFSKGYGYADVDSLSPVDPAATLFRIGSVSKLFTWTAVMQLVEEGRLDLDTDVNEYLDFEIPATYPQPITMRNIMTHTPGFEDQAFGLFGKKDVSRSEWLRDHIPARVRPPGTYSSYSNYATALAGYIVERISGMPWEDYIEERIMKPLGMVYATGRQPLPDELAPHMSDGYVFQGGKYVEKPFEIIDWSAPAGSVSASADAMAKFMIAHLQYGRLGDARILQEETSHLMQTRQFGHDPRLPGFALGFYEQSSHGLRLVGHGGDTGWFHTDLSLIPSEGVGVFLSTNTASGGEISFGPFLEAFLDHYYPVPPIARPAPPENWPAEAAKYAGTYIFNRRAYTTFEKVSALAGGAIKVSVGDPGELVANTPLGAVRVYETEPGLFRDPQGSMDVAFEENDAGGVTRLFLGPAPMMAGDKLSFWQNPAVHQIILIFCLLLFLSTLVLMPIRYFVQRSVDGVEPLRGRERGWRWLALALTVLNVGFLVALGVLVGNPNSLIEGNAGPLKAVLVIPMVAVPVTLAVAVGAVAAWLSRLWGRWGRVHYALFAIAAVVFLVELNYWNLLGWKI